MRKVGFVIILLATSCAQPRSEQRPAEDLRTFDVQEEMSATSRSPSPPPPPVAASTDSAGGPGIGVTAAPGVAFNYRYAYRLPNARIGTTQEAHASMCEKLTIARCRITGMRYSLVNERDISASLELKLDPTIARQFGKNATKLVTDSEGMLVDQQISGVDAGSSIERANRGRAQLQDELERVNRELARPGLSSVVRDRLLSEAASLRSQIAALGAQRDADEESLASTPMVFHYGSGNAIPGFDEATPLRDALDRAGYTLLSTVGFLIMATAFLVPWLLLAGLGYFGYRRLRRRWHWSDPSERREAPVVPAQDA